MRLGILIAVSVITASFCPRSEAQTNGLTAGKVISWGQQVIPYVQPGTRYQAIAAGFDHSLALKSDGTVVAWGANGFSGESTVPANLTGVIAIAAGGSHSLALKSDATVVAWGDNYYGESTVPTNLTSVVAIAAGYYHSLALKSDATVAAWGDNSNGQTTVPANLTALLPSPPCASHNLS